MMSPNITPIIAQQISVILRSLSKLSKRSTFHWEILELRDFLLIINCLVSHYFKYLTRIITFK